MSKQPPEFGDLVALRLELSPNGTDFETFDRHSAPYLHHLDGEDDAANKPKQADRRRPRAESNYHTGMRNVAMAAALIAATAHADTLQGTEGSAVRETMHTVSIELKDGYAVYTVQRAFVTARVKPDEAHVAIDIPEGATANQLRILANGTWYEGELLESQEASRKYQRLTGFGAAPVKDPALLGWVSNRRLSLRVYPVQQKPTYIEYKLVVPSTFLRGQYRYELPRCAERSLTQRQARSARHTIDPKVTVTAVDPSLNAAALSIAGRRVAVGATSAPFDACCEPVAIEVGTAKHFDVRGRIAQIDVASDREAVRIELDADSLSELPKSAAFVFAVDTSYSVGPQGVTRQVAVIRAIASHVPTAVFEIVTYARHAKRWFGRLVTRQELLAQLGKLERAPLGNGSELPAGTALAVQAMALHKGPRRIIATTDNVIRASMPDTLLVDAVTSDKSAIVHVVSLGTTHPGHDPSRPAGAEVLYEGDTDEPQLEQPPESGGPSVSLTEADELLWTKGANASGGACFSLSATKWATHTLRKPLLHLVRPIRVTHLHFVRAPADKVRDRMTDDEASAALALADLEEGRDLRRSIAIDKHEVTDKLQGTLWGKVRTWTAARSDGFSKIAGGLMIGDEDDANWTPFEQMALAKWSHVVSPVTSLIAIEPGTRPSRSIGTGSYGTGGGGSSSSGSTTVAGSENLMAPWDQILKSDKEACLQKHPQAGTWFAFFVLERALDEIMSVSPVIAPGATMSPLQNCLLEAVWAHHLTGSEPSAGIISFSS